MKGHRGASQPKTMQVFVPLSLHLRGGRKTVISPALWSCEQTPKPKFDNAMVKAIAQGLRWRDMLENGTYATIREIAVAEKINEILRRPSAAADTAGAGHRRGNPGWTAAGRSAIGPPAEAVSGGVDGPTANDVGFFG